MCLMALLYLRKITIIVHTYCCIIYDAGVEELSAEEFLALVR